MSWLKKVWKFLKPILWRNAEDVIEEVVDELEEEIR